MGHNFRRTNCYFPSEAAARARGPPGSAGRLALPRNRLQHDLAEALDVGHREAAFQDVRNKFVVERLAGRRAKRAFHHLVETPRRADAGSRIGRERVVGPDVGLGNAQDAVQHEGERAGAVGATFNRNAASCSPNTAN